MSMKTYHKLKEMLCEELDNLVKKGELTAGSLETADKLTHAIKSLTTIIAMDEHEGGESEYYPYMGGYRSFENDGGNMSNRGDRSYQRRDAMGRYSRENRGGYSRDDARADMIADLREIMQDAPDEHMKKKLRQFISEIEQA